MLVRSWPEVSLHRIRILWSVNEELVVSIEVTTFLRGWQVRTLVLQVLLVLFQWDVDGASLWSLNQKQNIVLALATFLIVLLVYIYKVLFSDISVLNVGFILFELFSELLDLS